MIKVVVYQNSQLFQKTVKITSLWSIDMKVVVRQTT